jgi:hypothetical protein
MPAMRCNEVVISIALVLRREAAETEQMSHRGHSPVALRERRTASMRHAMITKNQKPTTALSVALYAGVRFLGGYEIYAN